MIPKTDALKGIVCDVVLLAVGCNIDNRGASQFLYVTTIVLLSVPQLLTADSIIVFTPGDNESVELTAPLLKLNGLFEPFCFNVMPD